MANTRVIYSASFDESTVVSELEHQSAGSGPEDTVDDDHDNTELYDNYELSSIASLSCVENPDRQVALPPSNYDDMEEPSSASPLSIESQRSHHLETTAQLCDYFAASSDENVPLRIQDFWTARWLRRQTYGRDRNVYGVFGLFQYLVDLKIDLAWANEAAYRRSPVQVLDDADTVPNVATDCTSVSSSVVDGELSLKPATLRNAPYLSWTDFEHEQKQQCQLPYFSIIMFVMCSLALVASIGLNNWELAAIKINPMLGTTAEILIQMGALDAQKIVMGNEWYRILTAIVLHAGIIHYAVNMLALWFLGRAVEQVYGSAVTAIVFLVSAVGGNIASALLLTTSYTISVGASGGLFALLGICLADICANWDLITMRDPQHHEPGVPYCWVLFWLLVDLVVSVVIGLTPYVDNCIHVGGLVYALGIGLPFLNKCSGSRFFGKNKAKRRRCCCRAVGMLGLVATVALFTSTSALLFTQRLRLDEQGRPAQICKSCRYISCAPFPFWKKDKWWHCDGCDHVAADVFYQDGVTEVEISCPFHDDANVEVSGILDQAAVLQQLPSLCRAHCQS